MKSTLIGIVILAGFGLLFWQQQSLREEQTRMLAQLQMGASAPARDGKPAEDPYIKRELSNTLRKHQREVQGCYLAFLERQPETTEGTLHLDWVIDAHGTPKRVDVVKNELEEAQVAKCVIDVVSSAHFPAPPFGQEKYIDYRYNFTDGSTPPKPQGPILVPTPPKP